MNEPKQTELRIEGMNCGACVRHVTEALEGTIGVTRARVDLERGSATVEHRADQDVSALVAAVAKAGYSAAAA